MPGWINHCPITDYCPVTDSCPIIDYCPINEDDRPMQHQAWHAGWIYRMENGPGFSGEEAKSISLEIVDKYSPSMVSIWLQGYSAAANAVRKQRQE